MSDSPRKVLLVGWDAADWEHITPLLDAGKLPVLESVIDRGVMGNIATLQPMLSPMLWNSVATGKQPWKHGVHGFMEPDPVNGGQRIWSSRTRKTKALWNMFSQSGLKSNVVNWWASHPAEPVNGCVVSNLISGIKRERGGKLVMPDQAVHPASMADRLAQLAVFDHEFTSQQVLPLVPRAREIDQFNDHRLSLVVKNLADMVTTHNIATDVMENTEWDFTAVYYTAIDHFCHSFIAYHPPKLPWIEQEAYELYKDVVNGVYQFSDMTLGRLIQLAGEDATVIICSDHGFQSGEQRLRQTPNEPAGPAYWHRKYGIFVAAGPGIKKDERVYGATLVDVAPTILQMYGLPVGEDMDGRVLSEIFEDEVSVEKIPSWDDVDSKEDGRLDDVEEPTPEEAEELVNQFVALGYIDNVGDSKEKQEKFARTEAQFNLARNMAWCGNQEGARDIYKELFIEDPWESRFILHYCKALTATGCYSEAVELLERSYDLDATGEATAVCFWCESMGGLGRNEPAVERLRNLEARMPNLPSGVRLHIAAIYRKLGCVDDAEKVFLDLLRQHPDNAEAHMFMSEINLRKQNNQAAADHAMSALNLLYNYPRAHLNLGHALLRGGDYQRAEVALKAAVKIRPTLLRAHRLLTFLYERHLPNPELAAKHRKMASISPRRAGPMPQRAQPENINSWPEIPTEAKRKEKLEEHRPPQTNPARLSGKTLLLISGLPRSGTSLMMQMIEAGGIPAKTDGERAADHDNPKGYLEWEAIKKIASEPHILDEEGLDSKAIKVISALLPSLPYQHQYKVIFMDRPIEEVVASQRKMIERRGSEGASLKTKELEQQLEMHRKMILSWLDQHPRAESITVSYRELLENPEAVVGVVKEFVGEEKLPNWEGMSKLVDPSLYRNRARN